MIILLCALLFMVLIGARLFVIMGVCTRKWSVVFGEKGLLLLYTKILWNFPNQQIKRVFYVKQSFAYNSVVAFGFCCPW